MSYIDYEENLDKTMQGLPKSAQAVFSERAIVPTIEEIADSFELTMGEVGELCELVRQIITKEKPPEGFEDRLKEKLDEDNQPKAGDITGALAEKVFAKLFPALGIRMPLEMAIKPNVPEPPRPVPIKKFVPPMTSTSIPVRFPAPSAEQPIEPPKEPIVIKGFVGGSHQTYQEPVKIAIQERPKPPIMETSHEGLADNPLASLMKMLSGKISEKELEHQFGKLPESLQAVISSIDSAKKVVDIGRKHAIHVDKLGELGAETGMVVLGFTNPSQFLSRLTRRLDLPEEKVRPIAEEINTEIFLKIRDALKSTHGEGELPPIANIPTSAPSSPITIKPPAPVEPQIPQPVPINPAEDMKAPTSNSSPQLMVEEIGETLNREDILHDIENPSAIPFKTRTKEETSAPTAQSLIEPAQPKIGTIPENLPTADSTTTFALPASPQTISSPAPVPSPVSSPEAKSYQPSATSSPIAPAPAKPQSIIDQKLSGTTTSTASESHFSKVDPYREPLQ